MLGEEILLMPGDWKLGDHVKITRGNEVLVSGRIKEIVAMGVYKIDIDELIRARTQRPRCSTLTRR